MGFESTTDLPEEDVLDFLMGEDDIDNNNNSNNNDNNNNNFTYDDDDGDEVAIDPKAFLLDHNTHNINTIPLIVVAEKDENGTHLPKGYLRELEGYVSEEEHKKMMTHIQQTHSNYLNFWKSMKILGFMMVIMVLTIFYLIGYPIYRWEKCSEQDVDSDGNSTGLSDCGVENWSAFLGMFLLFVLFELMCLAFLGRLMKKKASLPGQRELKTDEERKRKVMELVEEMSDEQTFGRRVQYRINYDIEPYRVFIYLKKK